MPFKELQFEHLQDSRARSCAVRFNQLLSELQKRDLSDSTTKILNSSIDELNNSSINDKSWRKLLLRKQSVILKTLEKKEKLVPTNHYRNQWLAIGMAAFGIPFGVAFGAALGNMAFLGIGLPIGMAIGIGIGIDKDRRAAREGHQLDFTIG